MSLSDAALPLIGSALLGAPDAAPEGVTPTGAVIALTEALGPRGIQADAGPIVAQVVLVTGDGALVPLLSDPAGRVLFQDERLRTGGPRSTAGSSRAFRTCKSPRSRRRPAARGGRPDTIATCARSTCAIPMCDRSARGRWS